MFIRRFGWSAEETGVVFGLVVMISGTLGLLTGGRLADWVSEQGRSDAPMLAMRAFRGGLPAVRYRLSAGTVGRMGDDFTRAGVFLHQHPVRSRPGRHPARMMPNGMRAQATSGRLI